MVKYVTWHYTKKEEAMIKKLALFVISAIVLVQLTGCVALLAGAAGGAGTAVWLSGKLSQEVNVPYDRTVVAVKSALESLKLKVAKETAKADITQVISNYTDGRTVWIDIHRVSDAASKIEVRVGAAGDKQAAHKILDTIKKYL